MEGERIRKEIQKIETKPLIFLFILPVGPRAPSLGGGRGGESNLKRVACFEIDFRSF